MKRQESTFEVWGLVLNTVEVGERDVILSLFTREMGLISVSANGARQIRNRYLAAAQPFCYGKYLLARRGEHLTLREAELTETFYDLRTGIDRAALASYVCEVVAYTGTEQPDPEMLRLTLNTLYAIAHSLYPWQHIKAAFEWRCAALLGFMPAVSGCCVCGAGEGDFILSIPTGELYCSACRDSLAARDAAGGEPVAADVALLTPAVRAAIAYIVSSPPDRVLAFRLEENDLRLLSHSAEDYLSYHTDHVYRTLSFFKQVVE